MLITPKTTLLNEARGYRFATGAWERSEDFRRTYVPESTTDEAESKGSSLQSGTKLNIKSLEQHPEAVPHLFSSRQRP